MNAEYYTWVRLTATTHRLYLMTGLIGSTQAITAIVLERLAPRWLIAFTLWLAFISVALLIALWTL